MGHYAHSAKQIAVPVCQFCGVPTDGRTICIACWVGIQEDDPYEDIMPIVCPCCGNLIHGDETVLCQDCQLIAWQREHPREILTPAFLVYVLFLIFSLPFLFEFGSVSWLQFRASLWDKIWHVLHGNG